MKRGDVFEKTIFFYINFISVHIQHTHAQSFDVEQYFGISDNRFFVNLLFYAFCCKKTR